jgi:hypothetical protein
MFLTNREFLFTMFFEEGSGIKGFIPSVVSSERLTGNILGDKTTGDSKHHRLNTTISFHANFPMF